jgi:hypothetical protein
MRSFITCTFAKYTWDMEVIEGEVGGACSMKGGEYWILMGRTEGWRSLWKTKT